MMKEKQLEFMKPIINTYIYSNRCHGTVLCIPIALYTYKKEPRGTSLLQLAPGSSHMGSK